MNLSFEEAIELDKNLHHIDDETFSAGLREAVRGLLHGIFDDDGNYKFYFDSHRSYRKGFNKPDTDAKRYAGRVHEFLFDDDGNLREIVAHQLPFVIESRGFAWNCKAVHLHYANVHGQQTSGSYPATWMDK